MSDDTVLDALLRHGANSHRASSAVVNEITEYLSSAGADLTRELQDRLDSLTPAEAAAFAAGKITTSRLRGIDNLLKDFVATFARTLDSVFMPAAKDLVEHETNYTADVLAKAGIEGDAPQVSGVWSAALATPVVGFTVKEMLDEIPRTLDKRVRSAVRQGLADGQSASNIATAIRGTAQIKRKDGVLQGTRNSVDRDIRTARSHLAGQASEQTYQALGVRVVIHTGTLDGKLCKVCAVADGQEFRLDEPHPSATRHPHCRCFYRPKVPAGDQGERPYVRAEKVTGRDGKTSFRSIGKMTKRQREKAGLGVGQVKASVKFPEWLKTQDDDFARDWLGPKRFKLWKEGGYKLDRFVDPRGAELTIDQLRQKDRETFDRLFTA